MYYVMLTHKASGEVSCQGGFSHTDFAYAKHDRLWKTFLYWDVEVIKVGS